MTTKDFRMGFFGRGHFDAEEMNKVHEQWSKMTDDEKIEFLKKKMDEMDKCHNRFSVESIDARCEEWMKKTPEEKQQFIDERKEAFFKKREGMHGGFPVHGRHGFGCFGEKEGFPQ